MVALLCISFKKEEALLVITHFKTDKVKDAHFPHVLSITPYQPIYVALCILSFVTIHTSLPPFQVRANVALN